MTFKMKALFSINTFLAAILASQAGHAQAPIGQSNVLEEILVTAQRRSESLQEVPVAVSAFSEDQMETQQIDTPLDVANAVPNLQIQPISASAGAIQIHMRGASAQNTGFNTSESPVGIYVDDVYFGRLAGVNLDLNDVQQIEVLRGPQGTLYGRNTMAGAVKFTTRTPGEEDWTRLSASLGEFDTFKIAFSSGQELVEDEWAGSIAALYTKRGEGWQDNPVTGEDAGEYTNYALRAKLRYIGGEKTDATLQIWAADSENDGLSFVPYAPFLGPLPGAPVAGPVSTLSTNPSAGDSKQYGASLDITYDINDNLVLRSITAFSDAEDMFNFDLAGGGLDVSPDPSMPFYVNGLQIGSDSESKSFSQEFQLLGTVSENMDWIAGLYYLKEDGDQFYTGASIPFFGFSETTSNETKSYSVFAEMNYSLTDTLTLKAGGRYTRDDKTYSLLCNNLEGVFGGCAPASGASVALDDDWGEATFKLGLDWQVADGTLAYLTYAEGFQAGGFQTLCFGNTICAGEAYDPQTVQTVELGYKTDLLDNSLRINTAVFFSRYDDIQQLFISGAGGFPLGNVGEVDVYGVELEVLWRPTDGLTLFANLGTLSDEYNSLRPDALAAITNDLPNAPDLTYRVGFDYEFAVTDELLLRYGADYSYEDGRFTDSTNFLEIDDTVRANAFIILSDAGDVWSLELAGKNITDEDEPVSGIFQPGFANVRTVLPTREWVLTYNHNF